jgi:hypothetical protein
LSLLEAGTDSIGSAGRKQIGALGENKLEFWAGRNWGFGRKQIGVLGEKKLGFWAKPSWSVGRIQITVLGNNKLECLANTIPVLISTFMSFKEGHRNYQESTKRPQNLTCHVRSVTPLSHFASYRSNTRDRYVELITSGPADLPLGKELVVALEWESVWNPLQVWTFR